MQSAVRFSTRSSRMALDHHPLSRREFLAGTAGLVAAAGAGAASKAEPFSFLVIGDTHYLADRTQPEKLEARSAATTAKLLERLNALPGSEIDGKAGGTVGAPRGLIHAGDLIDTGDKNDETAKKLQQ